MFTIKARTATNAHYERSKNFAAAFSIYLLTPLESVKKTILPISLYYQLTLFIFTFVTCSVVVGTSSVQKNYALQFNGARLKGASNRILFVIEPKRNDGFGRKIEIPYVNDRFETREFCHLTEAQKYKQKHIFLYNSFAVLEREYFSWKSCTTTTCWGVNCKIQTETLKDLQFSYEYNPFGQNLHVTNLNCAPSH